MHLLPVHRRALGPDERELLEFCAEGWSVPLMCAALEADRASLTARLRALCTRLGMAPLPDGRPPVHAARMWLVEEARRNGALRRPAAAA